MEKWNRARCRCCGHRRMDAVISWSERSSQALRQGRIGTESKIKPKCKNKWNF